MDAVKVHHRQAIHNVLPLPTVTNGHMGLGPGQETLSIQLGQTIALPLELEATTEACQGAEGHYSCPLNILPL